MKTYREDPIHFLIIEDSPHALEEEIEGAVEDNDPESVNDIFLRLYKEGRTEEIERILTRYLFSEKEISAALERLGVKVDEMEEEDDLRPSGSHGTQFHDTVPA